MNPTTTMAPRTRMVATGLHVRVQPLVTHYVEMVLAMLAGMAALGLVSRYLLDLPDRPAVRIVEMAIWMTVPMTAWMRIRGHRWRACNEMAATMLVPAAAALAALATGAVTDPHILLMAEHVAMFPAMLVVMVLRPEMYACHAAATAA